MRSPHGSNHLFTSDTLYLSGDGNWKVGYFSGISDRDALIESLKLLRELTPDVVLSSAFQGDTGFMAMTPDDWPDLDGALAPLCGQVQPGTVAIHSRAGGRRSNP